MTDVTKLDLLRPVQICVFKIKSVLASFLFDGNRRSP